MTEQQPPQTPPPGTPAPFGGCASMVLFAFGAILALVFSLISMLIATLMFAQTRLGRGALFATAVLCFALGVGAIVSFKKTLRSNPSTPRPFLLGLMAGFCLAFLLGGLCYGAGLLP